MKIISFCLWGSDLKYCVGAIKNLELAKKFYPGWICRFYCDITVPKEIKHRIEESENAELVNVETIGDWKFTTSRFLPLSDDGLEYMISRDTDSRINEREAAAVREWVDSGLSAHIMRDHPYHGGFPILAGMFGLKGGKIKNIRSLLSLHDEEEQYHYDQIFLQRYIYPLIEGDVLVHDSFFENKPFPTSRKELEFVGQVFDENDNPVKEHIVALKKGLNIEN
jgi:protein O-GlcNAc transferase